MNHLRPESVALSDVGLSRSKEFQRIAKVKSKGVELDLHFVSLGGMDQSLGWAEAQLTNHGLFKRVL